MQVVRKVLDMLLALIRALSKLDEPAGPELEGWESLVFHCKMLETCTNDLVAGTPALPVTVDFVTFERSVTGVMTDAVHCTATLLQALHMLSARVFQHQDTQLVIDTVEPSLLSPLHRRSRCTHHEACAVECLCLTMQTCTGHRMQQLWQAQQRLS